MTHRITKARRLEAAGYAFYSGWLPAKNPAGKQFAAQVDMHREDVEKTAEEAKPRGRPKKDVREEAT